MPSGGVDSLNRNVNSRSDTIRPLTGSAGYVAHKPNTPTLPACPRRHVPDRGRLPLVAGDRLLLAVDAGLKRMKSRIRARAGRRRSSSSSRRAARAADAACRACPPTPSATSARGSASTPAAMYSSSSCQSAPSRPMKMTGAAVLVAFEMSAIDDGPDAGEVADGAFVSAAGECDWHPNDAASASPSNREIVQCWRGTGLTPQRC